MTKLKKQLAVINLNKSTHLERIKASYQSEEIQLTIKDKELKLRYELAFSLMHEAKYSRSQSAEIIQKKTGISRNIAYKDISTALIIFGDVRKAEEDGLKLILAEAYWNIYQSALKTADLAMQVRALDSYKDLFNFEKDEMDEFLKDKLQAHEYHLKLPRDVAKLIKQTLKSGVVNLNSYPEEIEFEEIENDADKGS